MRALIIFSVLFFLGINSFSQTKFNKRINPGFDSPAAWNVFFTADTGYAMVGGTWINNKVSVLITFTDLNGILKYSKTYGDTVWDYYSGDYNEGIKTFDGGYALAGSGVTGLYPDTDTNFVYLVRLDKNFDTLWTKRLLVDTFQIMGNGLTETKDKGFIIVGTTDRDSTGLYKNHPSALLLKVDSLGNYQWHKCIGGSRGDEFHKVIQTPDGGYLCGGWTASWQEYLPTTQVYRSKWWIVKTNSLGEVEWQKMYGDTSAGFREGRIMDMIMSSDTSYYIVSGRTQIATINNIYSKACIIKLNSDFSQAYERVYGETSWADYFMSIAETPDHNLVVLGSTSQSNFGKRATIYKLNANGDSIWSHQYTAVDTINTDNVGSAIKPTPDGGYIFAGFFSSGSLNPTQQLWLVKTDSMGCDGSTWWPCNISAIEKPVAVNGVLLYPNPANTQITLQFENNEYENEPIYLYNISGKLVKQSAVISSSTTILVNDLPSGLYLIKVGKWMRKLIIE